VPPASFAARSRSTSRTNGLRSIDVPLTLRLDRLHLAIQAAMGWANSHLYEIRAGDVGWRLTEADWRDGPLDAQARRIDILVEVSTKTLRRLSAIDRGNRTLPTGSHRGPSGYAKFLDAIHGPPARTARRSHGEDRLRVRSKCCRHRGATRTSRRAGETLVSKPYQAALPKRVNCGTHRMVTARAVAVKDGPSSGHRVSGAQRP
jgi:hypothetical protein